jgi:dTMP kinase
MSAPAPSCAGRKGTFISFEGGDGTGKSTQVKRLAARLRALGREVVLTREPGGSQGAEAIRALLVAGDKDRWSPMTEALLMSAARRDLLETVIWPALRRDAVVITDRFADSTMAYQGRAGGLGAETVEALCDLVISSSLPHATVILDVPVEESLARAGNNSGERRFEDKGADYHERVRRAYLDIAQAAPERCAVIDARGSVDDVAARIEAALRKRLPGLFGD